MANTETQDKVQCRYVNGTTAFSYAVFKYEKSGNPFILCSLDKCPYGDNLEEEIDHEGEHALNPKAVPATRVCKIEGLVDKILV